MSGTMGQAPPSGAPGGMPPGLPPQVMQALMARMQGGGGAPGMPGGPPGGPPQQAPMPQLGPRMMPPGSPGGPPMPPAPQGMNPGLALFGRAAGNTTDMQGQPGQPGQPRLSPGELAHLGRGGDSIVAHLTPGEIEVPKQVQTPKVLATLNQAFQQAGNDVSKFTAGSPNASTNPQTGMPEFDWMSSLLPMVLGAGATFLAPELLPGVFGASGALGAAAGPLAGGLGSALGSVIGGGNSTQALMSGLGGAAGGYFGAPGKVDAATAAASGVAAPSASSDLAANSLGAAANPNVGGTPGLDAAANVSSAAPGMFSNIGGGQLGSLKQALFAGGGAALGGMLAPPTQTPTALPSSMTTPLGPVNTNYNQILGNRAPTRPSFAGYNPIQSVQGGQPYNFYPTPAAV